MRRLALTLAGAAALSVAGCTVSDGPPSAYTENTYPVTPGHFNHPVAIGHGRVGADSWTLSADQDGDGQLCLGIRVIPYAGPQDFGCGFGSNQVDDEGRGTEPTNSAETKDGHVLTFGPSPVGATSAVLSTPAISGTSCRSDTMRSTSVPIRHRLPAWYPRHGAGWFVTRVPDAALDCVIDVRFLDAQGRTVEQPHDF